MKFWMKFLILLCATSNFDSCDCGVNGLRFLLYTKFNREFGQEQTLQSDNFSTISASHFIKNKPVKFLTHGYYVNYTKEFPQDTKNAYLTLPVPHNVIVVDWVELAKPTLGAAITNIRVVGAEIAKLIDTLIEHKYSKLFHFHHIGHSLGAQVGGFISRNLGSRGLLPRATALDTGGVDFRNTVPISERLDPTDAKLVDFITTGCQPGCTGTIPDLPRGTVDFYPNGGTNQPACEKYGKFAGSCAHFLSHQYFAESITTKVGFVSYKCPSYENFKLGRLGCKKHGTLMGEFVSLLARGTYYLDTNAAFPYARGRATCNTTCIRLFVLYTLISILLFSFA